MKKLRKPIAFLLAVIMTMMFNFPSGLFPGIGMELTVYAEDNTCNHEWGTEKTRTIDPTCTEGGYDVYECTQCGTEKKVPNDTPAIGHNKGENGKCTNCGAYMISNADELKTFAAAVNGGETSANAVLTANITVNEDVLKADGTLADDVSGFTSWTPIGYVDNIYTGTFNGQGHTISGLYFNDTNIDYVGLFGNVGTGGSVLNVGVVDSYFSGKNFVGGVCGADLESTIENCYNTGSVSGGDYVGGVCGFNYSGRVTNSYNTGSVSGSGDFVGGVCGQNYGGRVTNCYYLSKTSGSDRKTAAQFKSGEVAYLLSQGGGNGGSVWGQKIGTDDYPVLNGDTVYATTGCATYNNSGDTSEKEHKYEKGICTDCGGYKEPEKDESGVYQISKVTDLYWLADTVNSGNNSVNAVLTNDITVNEGVLKDDGTLADDVSGFTSWTPIGYYNSDSDNNPYTGTFNGQGHTISGLYFNDTNTDSVGLFGYVGTVTDENDNVISAGKVSNVGVVDSYFSGRNGVGGVCGGNNSKGKITNCDNTGTVSGSGYFVGGVCGYNFESTIENCYNTGSVSGSGKYFGGVCGQNYGGTLTNSYNTGSVSGSGDSVGGVCGSNLSGTITNCYYNSDICTAGAVKLEDVEGQAVGLTTLQMTAPDALTTMNFSSEVWEKKPADTQQKKAFYPSLKAIEDDEPSISYEAEFAFKNTNTNPVYGEDLTFAIEDATVKFARSKDTISLFAGCKAEDFKLLYKGENVGSLSEGDSVITGLIKGGVDAGEQTIAVQYVGTDYDIFSGLTSDCTVTIAKAAANEVKAPSATNAIVYGKKLSDVTLSDTNWSWVDGTVVPTVTNSGYKVVKTVTDDDNYDYSAVAGYDDASHTITRTIAVTVSKATPKVVVTAGAETVKAGDTVTVSAITVNPNNVTLTDAPEAVITYRIGDGEEQTVTNGAIIVPEDTVSGTAITITATTPATDNYEAGSDTTTVTVTGEPVLIGDVNGDGNITAEDALAILKHVVGLEELTGDSLTSADVNGENGITAEDALDVLKKVVGLLDKFKAEM